MIVILDTAVLDDRQQRVIFRIQPFTVRAGVTLTVTRGHSEPRGQLDTIERTARRHNCLFSEFESGNLHDMIPVWRGGSEVQVYRWQQTWSALLRKGVIINPPLAAVCLEDYIRPSGENMNGKLLHPSPHIKTLDDPLPCPIDFSARVDRNTPTDRVDIHLVADILAQAKTSGAGIRHIKPEPVNVCVHIDLER